MTNNTTKNGANPRVHGNGYHKDIPIPGEQGPALDVERDILWDILPQAIVSQRKGCAGRTWSCIEGGTAIDQVNRIFGHGDWGHDLVGEVVLRETEAVDQKTWELKTRTRAYIATVRGNVAGEHPRTDVGSATWPKRRPRATTPPTRER